MKKALSLLLIVSLLSASFTVRDVPVTGYSVIAESSTAVYFKLLITPPTQLKVLKIDLHFSNGTSTYTRHYNVGIQIPPGRTEIEFGEVYPSPGYHYAGHTVIQYINFYN